MPKRQTRKSIRKERSYFLECLSELDEEASRHSDMKLEDQNFSAWLRQCIFTWARRKLNR